MRQLTYVQAGEVAWQEAPDPESTDPAGAVVRPLAVARCDLDPIMAGFGIFPGPFAVGGGRFRGFGVFAIDEQQTASWEEGG